LNATLLSGSISHPGLTRLRSPAALTPSALSRSGRLCKRNLLLYNVNVRGELENLGAARPLFYNTVVIV